MAKVGRNERCPCGSGRKSKRCCGAHRGPTEAQLAKAYVSVQARAAAIELLGCTESDLAALYEDLFDLPESDLSLLVALPELVTPEITRLYHAVADLDPDRVDAVLPGVLASMDTPEARAGLARAVLAMRDRGRLGDQLAAVALIDLDTESSALLRASVIQSALVGTGAARTPTGLLVVAS